MAYFISLNSTSTRVAGYTGLAIAIVGQAVIDILDYDRIPKLKRKLLKKVQNYNARFPLELRKERSLKVLFQTDEGRRCYNTRHFIYQSAKEIRMIKYNHDAAVHFIGSNWYEELTDLDPAVLMKYIAKLREGGKNEK